MKELLKMLLSPRNLSLTIAALFSAIVVIIEIILGLSIKILAAGIVFLLGIIAIGLLSERVGYLDPLVILIQKIAIRKTCFEPIAALIKELAKHKDDNISAFYSNRYELPKFEDVIRTAREDIFLIANEGELYIRSFRGLLEAKVISNCNIRILLMNPNIGEQDNPLLTMLAKITRENEFKNRVNMSLKSLNQWHKELRSKDRTAADRLQIRLYDTLVTLTIIFVDAECPDGHIQVELIPHKFLGEERPSFDLEPKQGGELYHRLYERYQELWNESIPLSDLPQYS